MKSLVILLVALTLVIATPPVKHGKNPNREPNAEDVESDMHILEEEPTLKEVHKHIKKPIRKPIVDDGSDMHILVEGETYNEVHKHVKKPIRKPIVEDGSDMHILSEEQTYNKVHKHEKKPIRKPIVEDGSDMHILAEEQTYNKVHKHEKTPMKKPIAEDGEFNLPALAIEKPSREFIKPEKTPIKKPVAEDGEFNMPALAIEKPSKEFIEPEKTPIRKPSVEQLVQELVKDGEVEIAHTYEEIRNKIEEYEILEDQLNIPIDTPQSHMGMHYIDNTEEMQAMGINTMSINPDLLEDAFLLVPELIRKHGYPAERHNVQTTDGYVLEMHRIPYSPHNGPGEQRKQPVFLMHGLLDSSSTWVIMRPENGLAYLLADLGYDVWMGNARGNRYSRRHVTFNPDGGRSDRRRFWEFSWHEIGINDLPRMIDYVLGQTDFEKLHYIGHSQGTTSFFVMASQRPAYNDKILSMQALAPVAFMSNLRSPFVRAASLFLNTLDTAASVLGIYEFLPTSELLSLGGQAACRDEAWTQALCYNVLFLIAGFNSAQTNTTMIPVMLGHTPAGAAANQLIHYGQGVRSGRFRQFDWGMISNLWTYGSISPPAYNLANIRAPVALHYSQNDWLAEPADVEELHQGLPNVIGKFLVPDPMFNHLDFCWAIDVKTLLYDRVFQIMRLVEQGVLPFH